MNLVAFFKEIVICTPGNCEFCNQNIKNKADDTLLKKKINSAFFFTHSSCSLDFLSIWGDRNKVYFLHLVGLLIKE